MMLQECKGALKQFASNGKVENLDHHFMQKVKKFDFWKAPFGGKFASYLPTLKISSV